MRQRPILASLKHKSRHAGLIKAHGMHEMPVSDDYHLSKPEAGLQGCRLHHEIVLDAGVMAFKRSSGVEDAGAWVWQRFL